MSESTPDEQRPAVSMGDQLRQAALRAGIGKVAPGDAPSGHALLTAIGGVRGLVESILPGFAFLIIYTATQSLLPSVLIPVALGVVFVIVRAVQRGPVPQAIAGLLGIAISAILALISGRAVDNFLPGIVINIVSIVVLLATLVARWPLIGVVVGLITGEGSAWRGDRAKRRVLTITTWLWVLLFAIRLAIEIPLYLANQATLLGGIKLITGVPLYAAMLWVTWLLVRTVYAARAADAADEQA
ncbi:hypothetical protein AX769_13330 [Frondihabitans sp. PAMC 28766]|uniref:DUF3159 domain-containing protein n=1 Tax=Frondihabitans sp. PAMC 28766 TaxID=1795630 RepID=UPI00078D003B|nr:DUF3159 domain-containing protein [Frondihabitans sp. PAMC 28766]AMM20936.1 hypothetical protein AX769_13330 [Frondihabitans sp. PAMC 28766]